MDMPINYTRVTKLVEECYEEQDMDKRFKSYTNDYIDIALYRVEEKIRSINASTS